MKVLAVVGFVAGLGVFSAPAWAAAPVQAQRAPAADAPDRVAEAYDQFLLAQRAEDDDDVDAAIAAYRRAMSLDPQAADVVSALASLYMRQNRSSDATTAASRSRSPTTARASTRAIRSCARGGSG